MIDLTWFNLHPKQFSVFGLTFKLFNLFNRQDMKRGDGTIENHWGFGLLQICGRHLFYVGSIGFTILFIHDTNRMPGAEFFDYRGESFEFLPRISYHYCARKFLTIDWLWWGVQIFSHKYRRSVH